MTKTEDTGNQMEEALRASEERFSRFFAANPSQTSISRLTDGLYRDVNDMFVEKTGYRREEVLGRTSSELDLWFNSDDRNKFVALLDRDGRLRDFEAPLRTKSGDRQECVISADLIELDGETHVIATAQDITERKRAEQALKVSEERFRAVIDNSPTAFLLKDPEGRIQIANRTFLELYGWSLSDIVGRTSDQLFPLAIADAYLAEDRKALDARKAIATEHEITLKDGSRGWIITTKFPVFDSDRRVIGIGGMSVDITDYKLAEEQLRASEARFRDLAVGSIQGIVVLDQKSKPLFANAAAAAIFGYDDPEEILSLTSFDAILALHERAQINEYRKTGIDGIRTPASFLFEGVHRDGSRIWLQNITRMIEWDGKPAVQATLIDITERRQTEKALQSRDARLQQLQSELLRVNRVATIGALSSALTHELKQPLAAATFYMQAIGQMLKKGAEPTGDDIADILDKVGNQVSRATAVIDRLRPLLERGEVSRKTADINEVLEEAVAVASLELDQADIHLKTALGRDLPRVPLDRIQVQQVLLNLVRNGVEATKNSKRRELVVRTRLGQDGMVEVSVSDTGHGVPRDSRKSIFDPFETTRVGGTGVGLSVSRTIVEAHGGRIWVSPRRGGGTIMRFTLGLAMQDNDRSKTSATK